MAGWAPPNKAPKVPRPRRTAQVGKVLNSRRSGRPSRDRSVWRGGGGSRRARPAPPPRHVRLQALHVIGRDVAGLVGAAIPPHVDGGGLESGLGNRTQLM